MALEHTSITVAGVPTSVLRTGASEATLVFMHGGLAGVTPYCSGAHIWGDCLERFAAERPVLALDLPGSGGTGIPSAGLTVDTLLEHVQATLRALGVARCHLVGHDLGGLLALNLAADAPQLVRSVTAVASVAAAPTGDGVENFTLAYPPPPLWSRRSQAWALERVSYSHHHIDERLLDACVAAADMAPHRDACARMAQGANDELFVPSLMRAKSRFYELCRGSGLPVSVQIVWGNHDPLGTFDQGLWLFRIVATRQPAAQFHAINRAGALPFREEPDAFHQIVTAFCDAVFPSR